MIDYSISIGNLINIATLLCAIVAIFYGVKGDIRVIRHDIKYIQDSQKVLNEGLAQLSSILTKVALQEHRMALLEKNIDELRHGKGYVR